jgi:hypothetical protein
MDLYSSPVPEIPPNPENSSAAELLLDKIDALKVLRAATDSERDALLVELGGRGKPEQDIIAQLSAVRPLRHPDRFEEAHRMMVRSIEVLDRNGPRQATVRRLGPLTPIAKWLVEQASGFIVKSYINKITNRICGLYERREANSAWHTSEHHMLRRARIDLRRVREGMNSKSIGLPSFILGGAALTSVASGIQGVASEALNHTLGVIALGIIAVSVLFALSWVALFSAAVARRRIRLATDQSLAALWETIGAAGEPPRDESYNFAVYAIILLALAWIVVPLVIGLAFIS